LRDGEWRTEYEGGRRLITRAKFKRRPRALGEGMLEEIYATIYRQRNGKLKSPEKILAQRVLKALCGKYLAGPAS